MARLSALAVVLAFVVTALAARPPAPAPRSVIESEPLVVTARLPEGWTAEDGRVVPPASLRSVCEVRRHLVHDDWNRSLAAAMRDTAPTGRELMRIGGHVAVDYRTTTGSRTKQSVYINLEEIQPSTFAVWTVETENTTAGWQCQSDFSVLVGSVRIEGH